MDTGLPIFFRLDAHFGEPRHLGQLIAASHRRNIRVVMDVPVTHCHIDAVPARQVLDCVNSSYRNWFRYESTGAFQGFYGDSSLPELDLESPEVIAFVKQVLDHWLGFGIDGIRFDHAKRPPQVFWEEITDLLQTRYPEVFLLGENWHDSGVIGTLSDRLHGELNIPLSTALRQFLAHPGAHEVDTVIEQFQGQRSLRERGYFLPTFLDNHDLERASLVARGNHDILKLGYLLQFSLPYPPIIYYGSERAQAQSDDLPGHRYERDRYFREPMAWGSGEEMARWVRTLVRMRNEHIDLFATEPEHLAVREDHVLICRYTNADATIMTAINFGRQPGIVCTPGVAEVMLETGGAGAQGRERGWIELPGRSGVMLKWDHSA